MKPNVNIKLLVTAAGLCSVLLAGAASADYRITAFGHSSEYEALITGNVQRAKFLLGDRSLSSRDFVAANNYCVAQILAKEFSSAEEACTIALTKVESDHTLRDAEEKSAKASIYSNLAVALAMGGDIESASDALDKALSFNSRDRNAIANYDLVSEKLPANELARGF